MWTSISLLIAWIGTEYSNLANWNIRMQMFRNSTFVIEKNKQRQLPISTYNVQVAHLKPMTKTLTAKT